MIERVVRITYWSKVSFLKVLEYLCLDDLASHPPENGKDACDVGCHVPFAMPLLFVICH